ncbi:PLP-dependent aminotransferase family protein [Achromobacter sp. UMC71]|uniref:MocR-like pyridoxine biosynthesis transcription factor PdxR n=1 Tax=Achromobacter sp. UMC71 TaxID=1862320 RepID=UPI001601C8A9|nr:PLP-dependent aminotransferase family protein [Achromobacter sp. UMC71]MBB1627687.1 GntR family transcriptional regulator [Achromobacter sp. UMC71]
MIQTKPLRQEASLDLPLDPPREGESRQSWVYRQIRERILKGVLPSGGRLPSTRSLAARWHIARSTVEAAYDQLRSEGYTAGTVGSGTYVQAVIPDNFFRDGLPGEGGRHSGMAEGPSVRVLPVAGLPPVPAPRSEPPFTARSADASLFPMGAWRKGLMASAQRVSPSQLTNEESQGWLPLREQIARYLGAARGIACDASQVVVLTGIRDGIDLSARVLLSRADKVLVEDPGYLNAVPLFSQYTRRITPIAIDEQGFSVARARRQHGVKLVHVTPAHQSPTGVTMPVSRRLELLDWAAQTGCWILEDDYDSEFNYDGAPLAALKSLDSGDRVIHCGSFNKTLFNALRIGYAVLPRPLVAAFTRARHTTGRSNSIIEQMTLAAFLQDGSFARHVRRARPIYAARRDQLMRLLRQAAGPAPLRVSGEQAGFHLVWWLPPGVDLPDLLRRAEAQGIGILSVADFCLRVQLPPGVVIGYSTRQEAELERVGALLRGAVPPDAV